MPKTYGNIFYKKTTNEWVIDAAEPHICIRLKAIFPGLKTWAVVPFEFRNTPEVCDDLHWFLQKYPLTISKTCKALMEKQKKLHKANINDLQAILLPNYTPEHANLKPGCENRPYQLKGRDLWIKTKRILCGDELGLGKTTIALMGWLNPALRPGLAVMQPHLNQQWADVIERFTDLKIHIIKTTKPYSLPPADVYIMKYTQLAGWSNVINTGVFKSVVFDECQELRHDTSARYEAASIASKSAEYVMGMSHSPIYNYANEIYNVINCIKPDALGEYDAFAREWFGGGRIAANPEALGTFLRSNFLLFRRTRKEVQKELPPVNTIVHTVGYDEDSVEECDRLAEQLAIKVTSGEFTERGKAARDLDMLVRQTTGISKAKYVAAYVKILLENNEPVLLAGWHREVYDIWLRELAEYNPVMYTGTESPAQKEKSKQAFLAGESNLMIISLRSGTGLDGLQQRCSTVVIGELDWSPKVHEQLIGRVDREGQKNPVTAIYLISNYGSDEFIVNLLGLKSSQSHGIMDPLETPGVQHSDESRIKLLAQQYLKKKIEIA